jgi:hypothetical protein
MYEKVFNVPVYVGIFAIPRVDTNSKFVIFSGRDVCWFFIIVDTHFFYTGWLYTDNFNY